MKHTGPRLAVDALIIEEDMIVLVKRKNPPYQDQWALPGGFVEYAETVEEACVREVKEETGLFVKIEELAGVYSDPKRDPRGHTVSVVFLCKRKKGELKADSDAKEAKFFPLADLPGLAFDHEKIIKEAF